MKIEQAEHEFADKVEKVAKAILAQLDLSVPSNYRLRAHLLDENGRKKRSSASAENWSPESDRIEIWFERESRPHVTPHPTKSHVTTAQTASVVSSPTVPDAERSASGVYVHPAEAELLRALDRAEATPGWNFVPLKKFRDEILPTANTPSIRTAVERHSVLRSAIDKKLIVTNQVTNPKNPQFPVRTVRVNRLKTEVRAVLGETSGAPDIDFHPVEIRGEPLSATVIRERR